MKRLLPVSLLVGGLMGSACVPPQELTVIEREQRRLRSEGTKIRTEATALRDELDGVRSFLADARASLEEIRRDVGVLKEQVEEVRYQVDRKLGQSAREGNEKINELEIRITRIDDDLRAQGTLLRAREEELRVLREAVLRATRGRGKIAGLPRSNKETKAAGGEPVPTGELDPVRKDYEEAWKLLERKDYRGAIARFKKFLEKHAESEFADNAQYWIGESYYALREFDQAILEFDAVRRKYPKGDKVPAALLKQGFAFAELGDKVDARLILRELIARYPDTKEAVKAKQRVKALES